MVNWTVSDHLLQNIEQPVFLRQAKFQSEFHASHHPHLHFIDKHFRIVLLQGYWQCSYLVYSSDLLEHAKSHCWKSHQRSCDGDGSQQFVHLCAGGVHFVSQGWQQATGGEEIGKGQGKAKTPLFLYFICLPVVNLRHAKLSLNLSFSRCFLLVSPGMAALAEQYLTENNPYKPTSCLISKGNHILMAQLPSRNANSGLYNSHIAEEHR